MNIFKYIKNLFNRNNENKINEINKEKYITEQLNSFIDEINKLNDKCTNLRNYFK